jgi:hypothetical protein
MYQNNKKIFISALAAVMILLFASQAMSQTMVLGLFQLGKSTYDEVKANLPKGVKITSDNGKYGASEVGGPLLVTNGENYDINGLKAVEFGFDEMNTLAEVNMFLEGRRLNDINKILSSKYQQVRSYPGVWMLFKANHDYIYLYLMRDKNFVVNYMTGAVYRRGKLEEHQTVEYNKKYARENKKALEQEAAAAVAKF